MEDKKPITLKEMIDELAKLSPAKQKMAVNFARVLAKQKKA